MKNKTEELKNILNRISEVYSVFKNKNFVLLTGSYCRGDFTEKSDIDLIFVSKDNDFESFIKFKTQLVKNICTKLISIRYIELTFLPHYFFRLSNWLIFLNNSFIDGDKDLFEEFKFKIAEKYSRVTLSEWIFLYLNDLNRNFKFSNSNIKNGKFGFVDIEFFKIIKSLLYQKNEQGDQKIDSIISKNKFFIKQKKKKEIDNFIQKSFHYILNIHYQYILYYRSRKILLTLINQYGKI